MVIPLKKVTELHKHLFQSEAECEAIDMKMILSVYSYANKILVSDQAPQWWNKREKKSASDCLGRRNATQNSSASLKRCFLFASLSHHWLYKLTLFVQNCLCKECLLFTIKTLYIHALICYLDTVLVTAPALRWRRNVEFLRFYLLV